MEAEVLPKITKEDISVTPPAAGGTKIVLQRHGVYERKDPTRLGLLTPEAESDTVDFAFDYFTRLFRGISDERFGLDILFLTSDSSYQGAGKRSWETTELTRTAINRLRQSLYSTRTLNDESVYFENEDPELIGKVIKRFKGGTSRVEPKLREPKFLTESPEFKDFLSRATGAEVGTPAWFAAFEEDRYGALRLSMGVEGPMDIVNRLTKALQVQARWAKMRHRYNLERGVPPSRLVMFNGTHYDTISPWVKCNILNVGIMPFQPVDYLGGIAIDIDPQGSATVDLKGKRYEVPLLSAKR